MAGLVLMRAAVCEGRRGRKLNRAPAIIHTERIVVNVKAGDRPSLSFVGGSGWIDLADGWAPVRQRLDAIWNAAGKRDSNGHQVADVVLEVRADEELPYRLVQELQQIAADSVDPETMAPGRAMQRSFVNVDFAVVPPG